MNDPLITAALTVWPFNNSQPYAIGVEAGIVWATARNPMAGINGYALIPAEGHPWSAGWPTGVRDQPQDRELNQGRLNEITQLMKAGLSPPDAALEVYSHDDREEYEVLDSFVDVHGGVTWYTHPWIGFDTLHAGDIWGPEWDERDNCRIEREYRQSYSIDWTPEKVMEEAKGLARQIAAITDPR